MATNHEQQVVDLFRPLLDKIDLSSVPQAPNHQLIELCGFDTFLKHNLGDCVLTIRRRNFNSTPSGYFTFSHKTINGQNIFFLNIFLNNTLFASDTPALRIKRHRTLAHEFTHCIASFLSVEKILKSPALISQMSKDLAAHTNLNIQEHFQSLLVHFGNVQTPIVNALEIFPDEHFKTGYDNFRGSFATVYKLLILDNKTFEKYFTAEMQKSFNGYARAGNITEILTIIQQISNELITNEAISNDFINLRLREELLQYYYLRAFRH